MKSGFDMNLMKSGYEQELRPNPNICDVYEQFKCRTSKKTGEKTS